MFKRAKSLSFKLERVAADALGFASAGRFPHLGCTSRSGQLHSGTGLGSTRLLSSVQQVEQQGQKDSGSHAGGNGKQFERWVPWAMSFAAVASAGHVSHCKGIDKDPVDPAADGKDDSAADATPDSPKAGKGETPSSSKSADGSNGSPDAPTPPPGSPAPPAADFQNKISNIQKWLHGQLNSMDKGELRDFLSSETKGEPLKPAEIQEWKRLFEEFDDFYRQKSSSEPGSPNTAAPDQPDAPDADPFSRDPLSTLFERFDALQKSLESKELHDLLEGQMRAIESLWKKAMDPQDPWEGRHDEVMKKMTEMAQHLSKIFNDGGVLSGSIVVRRHSPPPAVQSPPPRQGIPDADDDDDDDDDDEEEEKAKGPYDTAEMRAYIARMERMGLKVYLPDTSSKDGVDWGELKGYAQQKQQIEETILLGLQHPEVLKRVVEGTRASASTNQARGVLFEGPPGCGKTTTARLLARQAGLPLVYIPFESIMTKWYGESEKKLAEALSLCEKMKGCIVFMDELDALATSRGSGIHEATRRVLGVLLRFMDGFDSLGNRSIVIGATNRKGDLDAALISRFDTSVHFQLPTKECRADILCHYAKHLSDPDLQYLAGMTEGMSGRDLRDLCQQTERRWASKTIKGEVDEASLPGLSEYLHCAQMRLQQIHGQDWLNKKGVVDT